MTRYVLILRTMILASFLLIGTAFAEEGRDEKQKPGGEHHADHEEKKSVPAGAVPHPSAAPHPGAAPHPNAAPGPEIHRVEGNGEVRRAEGGGGHEHEFHGGIRPEHWDHPHFRMINPLWISGYWYEGWFAGLYGWWWVVDGQHYLYNQPVYPYPNVISDMVLDAPPPPPASAYAVPSQPQGLWYYCENPAGYYPYVQACAMPFRAVQPH